MACSSEEAFDEVLEKSAVDLARMVAVGEVSSEELTRACLDRIARLNPHLCAFVTYGERRSLFAARRRDRARRTYAKSELPPFWGVPTGIKDLNFAREFPTRLGSAAVRFPFVPVDDALTRRVRAAGFVVLGKLATSEAGALPVTEPLTHAPTLTPWCLEGVAGGPRTLEGLGGRSAGGSSGGSGAAVASGLLPIAPGSDGAGSIRIPAAFNGLVGMKPSRGRVANAFGLPDRNILYTDGPIARSVGDAAHMLDALSGMTVGKPSWAPPPDGTFAELMRRPLQKLRVRVSYEHSLGPTDPDIRAAVRKAADELAREGHDVEEHPWLDLGIDVFLPVWQHSVAESRILLRTRGLSSQTAWLIREGKTLNKAFVASRQAELSQRTLDWFGEVDIWLSPTVSTVAPPVGLACGDGELGFRNAAPLGGFTAPFNLTGQPALSLPVGLSRDGLPLGIQLAGRLFEDGTVLALAAQMEAARGAMPRPACRLNRCAT